MRDRDNIDAAGPTPPSTTTPLRGAEHPDLITVLCSHRSTYSRGRGTGEPPGARSQQHGARARCRLSETSASWFSKKWPLCSRFHHAHFIRSTGYLPDIHGRTVRKW